MQRKEASQFKAVPGTLKLLLGLERFSWLSILSKAALRMRHTERPAFSIPTDDSVQMGAVSLDIPSR